VLTLSETETAAWKFVVRATWPHEYVIRTPENAEGVLALARHIFDRGTDGRFYSQVRKYRYGGRKVYWSMDARPEATCLVNRCDETRTYEARLAAGTPPR
jgi:hypothetical protein